MKTETLGSTDGFGVEQPTYIGYAPQGRMHLLMLFWLVLAFCAVAALLVSLYFRSVAGALAVPVRDSEIRLEFLGISVNRLIHLNLVIAGTLAGIGGALAALSIEHVDPNMAYWTTSGGFVFVTVLAGAGSVAAAFRRLVRVRAFEIDRLRHPAGHLADVSRRGAALHHPVPARRASARCSPGSGDARTEPRVDAMSATP